MSHTEYEIELDKCKLKGENGVSQVKEKEQHDSVFDHMPVVMRDEQEFCSLRFVQPELTCGQVIRHHRTSL